MRARAGLFALLAGITLPAQEAPAPLKLAVKILPPDYVFHFTPRVEMPERPSVGLVLSGGGARGLAHIGVLQCLDDGGYPIDSIVGTSAGALTGTLYACGFSGREIEALFRRVDFSRAFLDPLVRTPGKTLEEQEAENGTLLGMQIQGGLPSIALGLKSGREVQRTLEGLLARGAYFSGGDFNRLRVPLRVLATNLETGQGRLFAKGDMVEVLRAAMAVPGAFKPVVIENQQYVDGALVENIPVFQSKSAFNPKVLLAVDVSSPMEKRHASNFLSVASRSLDLVIEQRQRESAAAASLVLRPEITGGGFSEYGGQLSEMVSAGAQAFRDREPELRRLFLEGLGDDETLPAKKLEIRNPVPVDPTLTRLIQTLLPEGQPFRRRHVLVVMQQAISRGWLRDLTAEVVTLAGTEPTLRLEFHPFAPVREHQVEAPVELREAMLRELRAEFPVGERFNPRRLGDFLGRWVHASMLNGRPLLDVRGSGFEDDSGCLRIVVQEPTLRALSVRGARGREEGYLAEVMRPLLQEPVRSVRLRERLDLAVERLRLAELRYQLRPRAEGDGAELVLAPVHDQPHTLDFGLGWESTLGGQVGLRYRTLNLGVAGWELVVEGAKNGLQRGASLSLAGPFRSMPGAGLELKGTVFEQRLGVPLFFPAPEVPGESLDLRIRSTDGSFGAFARFGNLGQGRVSLSASLRRAQFLREMDLGDRRERAGELALEWDDFDRHTLPRDGLLLRGFYAAGQSISGLEPKGNFRMAYVRARGLASFGPGQAERQLGADLDLEWGYGDRLPLDRWWTLGGSSFLVGSKSLGFLAPNFLVGRFGLPLRVNGPYGLSLQVIPRFDCGVIGENSRDLFRSLRGQGTGVVVRTMASRFYVELSYGFLKLYDPAQGWSPATGTFNALIGTQPFDLWKRR